MPARRPPPEHVGLDGGWSGSTGGGAPGTPRRRPRAHTWGSRGRLREITFRELADTQAAIVGSPATVREQITEFVKEFRIGNLLVMLHGGSMPHDLVRYNIGLFSSEVLPHLRGIWDDEAWEHQWWPTGIGARAPAGDVAAV
jgi:alkanesulfonate monooxygenase SsuD/methylene tetrahydromethanopterin reductase-like flavin-dependent oxidoreductase (luciferase family)